MNLTHSNKNLQADTEEIQETLISILTGAKTRNRRSMHSIEAEISENLNTTSRKIQSKIYAADEFPENIFAV